LKHTRQRFQVGGLRKVSRTDGCVWERRYRYYSQPGSPQLQLTLSSTLYQTEPKALAAVQALTLKVNASEAFTQKQQDTTATLIERYIETERLNALKALRAGEPPIEGAVQDCLQLFDNLESLHQTPVGPPRYK
jgi:hypothetical protein